MILEAAIIDRMERIERQLTRIADALDRAIPPVNDTSSRTPSEDDADVFTVTPEQQAAWELEEQMKISGNEPQTEQEAEPK